MQYRRGWVALFLFTLAIINYVDRGALSFAAGSIVHEFGLSPVTLGYVFSSFLWSYVILLLPAGMLVLEGDSDVEGYATQVRARPRSRSPSRRRAPGAPGRR